MFVNNPGGVFKLVLLIYLYSTLSVSIKLGARIREPQYRGSLYCVTQQIHGESKRSINLTAENREFYWTERKTVISRYIDYTLPDKHPGQP